MADSKSSEFSLDDEERKRSTKGRGKERRLPALENGYIIATRVEKALKRWKTLQREIPRKQEKVNRGDRSKRLELSKKERDELVEQMKKDIPELQSIFDDEYSNAFDRKDKRRTTTGGMLKEKIVPENRETHSLRPAEAEINKLTRQLENERKHKEEALLRLQSVDAEINKLTRQLENERMCKEEALLRKSEEYRNEISTLEHRYQVEIKNLEEDMERTKEQEQLQRQATRTEMKEKDIAKEECKRLKRKLDESENEKVALELSHKEEMGAYKEEIRKLKERLTIDKSSYQKREKELKTKCDELEADIASYKKNWTKSEDAKIQLVKKITELENKSKEGEREFETWNNRLEDEKRRTEGELKRLEAKNNQLTSQLDSERKANEDALLSYKENWTRSEDAKIQLEIKITEEENVAMELENKSKEGECETKIWKNRLEEEKRRTEGELKRIQAMYNQLKIHHENEKKVEEDALLRLVAKNNQLSNQLDSERQAKEDALLRLSSMESNKLRENDPNTADLSDPIQPSKLSEQFSELYDNEWTDAFDELEKLLFEKEDKEIISYLRDFVLEIHSFCRDISSSKLKTIEDAFVKPSVPSEDTKIPTEIFETIKDGIQSIAPKLLEHTRERVLGRLEEKYFTDPVAGCLQHQNVKRYIDKCTEVCWYMSVQDPQLVMDGSKSPDEKFDSNKHREYTKNGPYEEFVVWPVLYLYRGGPMLSKGVAQGGKKMIGQQ